MCRWVPGLDGFQDSLEPPAFPRDTPINRGFEKAASFSILPNLFLYWSKNLIFICLQVIFFLKPLHNYLRKKSKKKKRWCGVCGENQNYVKVSFQWQLLFIPFFLLPCPFWEFFTSTNFPPASLSFPATSDLRTVFRTFDGWSDQFFFDSAFLVWNKLAAIFPPACLYTCFVSSSLKVNLDRCSAINKTFHQESLNLQSASFHF